MEYRSRIAESIGRMDCTIEVYAMYGIVDKLRVRRLLFRSSVGI